MLGVDINQMSSQYNKLIRSNIVFPPTPFSRLFFIKTKSVGSNMIEVHYIEEQPSFWFFVLEFSWTVFLVI